jgi:hypothetical protein
MTSDNRPDGPPAAVRLRRLLKTALRFAGLRCTAVREFGGTEGRRGQRSARHGPPGATK